MRLARTPFVSLIFRKQRDHATWKDGLLILQYSPLPRTCSIVGSVAHNGGSIAPTLPLLSEELRTYCESMGE